MKKFYIFFLLLLLPTWMYAQIPTDSLVVYYPFNGDTIDHSGNGKDCSIVGNVTWGTDRFGNTTGAINFDECTRVERTNFPEIHRVDGQELSICYWFNPSRWEGPMSIVSNRDDPNGINWGSGREDLSGKIGLNTWEISNYSPSVNKWTFFVATISSDGTLKMYINGHLDTTHYSFSYRTYDPTVVQHLCIGSNPGFAECFSGLVDDVRLYNRALSGAEVLALFHEDDMVAYYPFNKNANDESGHDINGTVFGAVLTTDRFENDSSAYDFNGVDNQIAISTNFFNVGRQEYTITGWFNSHNVDQIQQTLFNTIPHGGVSVTLNYSNSGGTVDYFLSSHPEVTGWDICAEEHGTYSGYQNDQWYNFAFTKNGDLYTLYINGNLDDTLRSSIIPVNYMCGLRIGATYISPEYFNGKLDDFSIYSRALTEQEIKSLYGNYRQQIVSITDIPNDQGVKVRIKWNKIYLDSAGTAPQITSYGVWRKIPPGMSVTKRLPSPMSIMNDTLGVLYDYLGTVNATQSPSYNFVAQTLQDSSESGTNAETFLITAHTSDPNVYYISDAAMGYSVDNIAPSPVTSLAALWQTGPYVNVSWNPNQTDQDFHRYEIYKSTTKNFVPTLGLRIGSSINPEYQDADVTDGYRYYYQVLCVDHNGNHSQSPEVYTSGNPINRTVSLNNAWNMISVPLDVNDFSKPALYPMAISNAFQYDGTYKSADTLQIGKGYWIKVGTSQEHSMPGYLFNYVNINVKSGWNMIGSISEPVLVSNISSDPPEMTTSEYFEFNNSYQIATVITPGKGYWVKVENDGKLILSLSTIKSTTGKIKIIHNSELPPAPPEIISSEQMIPNEFILTQNYPNPFNPTTIVKYGLPEDANVTLSVFNTLGQEVGLLVSGFQKAGYHEVNFNAFGLTSGVYFYRIQAGEQNSGKAYTETKKLLLMK
jgi:hypothetical protein